MILAAGRGERLRPITDALPKALVEVAGEPLLERHLKSVRAAGISQVVINLGWLGGQIRERVGTGARYGLQVSYSDEGTNVLETGGGIHKALPLLGDQPFLVVNADIYTDIALPPAPLSDEFCGHLVLVPTPAHKVHGDFDLVEGRVCNGDQPAYTFSGIAVYRPEFFADCASGRFPLAPMLRSAAAAGQLSGEIYAGTWRDVGTPESLAELNRSLMPS
jgi:MurNAc alpha-1-phosphate uridylyltransferase